MTTPLHVYALQEVDRRPAVICTSSTARVLYAVLQSVGVQRCCFTALHNSSSSKSSRCCSALNCNGFDVTPKGFLKSVHRGSPIFESASSSQVGSLCESIEAISAETHQPSDPERERTASSAGYRVQHRSLTD
eukprot:6165-Heterococcus_DN1.PRE.1